MDRPGAPDRFGRRLGQRDVAGLALLHHLRQRADRFLDRHRGIDARHAENVEAVDAEALQALLAGLAQVVRRARARLVARVLGPDRAGLGMNHGLVALALDGLADQALVVALAVGMRGVEEVDAEVERPVDRGDALVVVLRAVAARHAHAAEAHARDGVVRDLAEGYVLHRRSPLRLCASGRLRPFSQLIAAAAAGARAGVRSCRHRPGARPRRTASRWARQQYAVGKHGIDLRGRARLAVADVEMIGS